MKKDLHPKAYRPVVFEDLNNGHKYIVKSTAKAEDTVTLDGTEYPHLKVHITGSSHPFYTGEERVLDIEGRVDKFKARAEAAQKAREARMAKAKKTAARAEKKSADDSSKQDKAEQPI